MTTKYKKYKELKKFFNFEYRGFNMGEVMAMDIMASVCNKNFSFYLRHSISLIYRKKNFSILNDIIDEDLSLNTYTPNREYHRELTEKYVKKLNINSRIFFLNSLRSERYFDIKYFFSSMKIVLRSDNIFALKYIYFSILLSHHKILIDLILKENIKLPKSYYAFNSSTGLESLLTLYFKQKGVNTYSLQHGLYFSLNNPVPNIINIENILADKVLCWGNYSIEEMVKFGVKKDRLIQFGNPKYTKIIPYIKKNCLKRCLVLLSRQECNKGNIQLISMLTTMKNIKFDIKLHSTLNFEYYKNVTSQFTHINLIENNILLSEIFKKDYDFSITYNTTTHYESLISGIVSFGYDFESDGGILFKKFTHINEIYKHINYCITTDHNIINKKIERFIFYTLGVK
jgi:hypothetical protein